MDSAVESAPTWFTRAEGRTVLDVRDDIGRGVDPFTKIMGAISELQSDAVLTVRSSFEPVPLYGVLSAMGFKHYTQRMAEDDWLVAFGRAEAPVDQGESVTRGEKVVSVDVRGLEPPEPLRLTLETLAQLEPDQILVQLSGERPTLLLPKLDRLGYVCEIEEEGGLVKTVIRRR